MNHADGMDAETGQQLQQSTSNDSGNDSHGTDEAASQPPSYKESMTRKMLEVWKASLAWVGSHLNFYRVHLIVFTFTPLIFAGIMWAIDTGDHDFVDILTLSVSSMTVCGLNPLLMETINRRQQGIAFFLMCIGSTSFVSLITIAMRRQFFKKRFEVMVKTDPRARKRVRDVEEAEEKERQARFYHNIMHGFSNEKKHGQDREDKTETTAGPVRNVKNGWRSGSPTLIPSGPAEKPAKKRKRDKLRVDMIRRIDTPVRVNQMNVGGFLSDDGPQGEARRSPDAVAQSQAQDMPGNDANVLGTTVTRSDSPQEMTPQEPNFPVRRVTPPSSPRANNRIQIVEQASPRARRISLPATVGDALGARSAHRTQLSKGNVEEEAETSSQSSDDEEDEDVAQQQAARRKFRRASEPAIDATRLADKSFKRVRTMDPPRGGAAEASGPPVSNTKHFPRTQTIEIREPTITRSAGHSTALPHIGSMGGQDTMRRRTGIPLEPTLSRRVGVSLEPTRTFNSDNMPRTITRNTAMTSGFGGFPNPVKIVASAARDRLASRGNTTGLNSNNLEFTRTTTLQSVHSQGGLSNFAAGPTKAVSYISFDAVVGRNSRFYSLTSAQRDELGGVEYRALSALLKIVGLYWALVQLLPILIFAPIFQYNYRWLFTPDQGTANNQGGWYAAFNVVSAYTNTGTSLLDESMVPFARTYGWVLTVGFLILAGNTALPIFLRFVIWTMSKVTPKKSRFNETLQFLLDHPRRCFIYLFPSHQTWILVFMLVVLNLTDLVGFLVLDIGTPVIEALPAGVRIIDGLFQAFAVRAAGFAIVPLAETAPALKVLYVVMMYIAVYPIAMSVRSTNVYEERSMGVFNEDDTDSDIEADFERDHKAGSYFAHHARKQLAFDIWWLAFALWAICIVERHNIDDRATDAYFNVFTILFELVSAYGTVGLSLGTPTANYSLCGDFRRLSKLILCAVMIRGRHRGLPVAIDRSILLPSDLEALHSAPSDAPGRRRAMSVSMPSSDAPAPAQTGSSPQRQETAGSGGKIRKFQSREPMEGSSRPRKMSSNTSSAQRSHKRKDSASSPSISFAQNPPTPKTPATGLNGFLATVYSAAPSLSDLPASATSSSAEEYPMNRISSHETSSEGTSKTALGKTS